MQPVYPRRFQLILFESLTEIGMAFIPAQTLKKRSGYYRIPILEIVKILELATSENYAGGRWR